MSVLGGCAETTDNANPQATKTLQVMTRAMSQLKLLRNRTRKASVTDTVVSERRKSKGRRVLYSLIAELVVALHLTFIGFVVCGSVAVLRWPRLVWIHVPVVLWGVWVEWSGTICPLTPLEKWLRVRAGTVGYEGDFFAEYLLPVLYPVGLNRGEQIILGFIVVVINVVAYGWIWSRNR